METTSIKAPTLLGPAHSKAALRFLTETETQNRRLSNLRTQQSKTKQFTKDLTGIKSVEHLQETIAQAFGLFFGTETLVHTHFTSNGKAMTLTCQANGLVTTITMSEKGGIV